VPRLLAVHRRAGTQRYRQYTQAPDQQRIACALRCIRGTIPRQP